MSAAAPHSPPAPGLRRAVELVEAGGADVLIVAFFDRLFRSLKVQLEVVERVEQAGGTIIALDVGAVGGSAARTMNAHFLGAVAQYHRTVTAERTVEAKTRAIARGVPTYPRIPPGYRRDKDGRLEPGKGARAVTDAFKLRAEGATIMAVRAFLRRKGVERSFHGVQAMFGSASYLGELHFGDLVNLSSHTPLVDPDTWSKVQRMKSPRGRRPKSDMLLARLGVLRCASCGARLVVGTQRQQGKNYSFYRCPPLADCHDRVAVSATIAEAVVVDAVKELLAGVEGTASIAHDIESSEHQLQSAEDQLNAAIEAFDGLDVPKAKAKLGDLCDARDRARDRLAGLQAAAAPALTVSVHDWHLLTLDERRALIRATIAEAAVAPGRGRDRITVYAHGTEFPSAARDTVKTR